MSPHRKLHAAVLVCFCLGAGVATADTARAAPAPSKTSDEVKIPQVIIIGKRLSAEQKARMAQEENDQKENKVLSKKSPRKAARPARHAG